jgi:chitinase
MGCDNARKIKQESAQNSDPVEYLVVGYVAGYRDFDFSTIKADKLTHINYAFANVIDGEVHFDTTEIDNTELKASDIEALHALKRINPDLKILVSVGGWVWSGNFSDCALTEKARQKFAKSCAAFVKKYRLDGIDIDWEYPNQVGAGNVHRVEDVENFTLLLKSVREHLDSLAAVENTGHLLLTIATGADSTYLANTRLGEVSKYLDFLNIMSYDLYHGNDAITGHHSNLYPSMQTGPKDISVSKSVEMHLAAGVPIKKINLGIPFYGRKWEKVKSDENNGLFQDAGSTGQIAYYRTLATTCTEEHGYREFWDDAAKAPMLWHPDSAIFISYENAQSIAHKMDFVKEKGLGGVMFWEYSDDHESRLLDAIHQGLNP